MLKNQFGESVVNFSKNAPSVEITMDGNTMLFQGMIENGKFKSFVQEHGTSMAQGLKVETQMVKHYGNPATWGHIILESQNRFLHIIPQNTENNKAGCANAIICVEDKDHGSFTTAFLTDDQGSTPIVENGIEKELIIYWQEEMMLAEII